MGTTEGTGETARQFIAEVTTNRGGGASWTSHGNSSPLDWSVGGDSSPAGVTGFGTWGNQQVTATDSEDWINLDFSQDLDVGVLKSLDFGARYADHERKTESPEGASPGDIWSDLQNGETAAYPSDFAKQHRRHFPAQPLVLHSGRAEGGDPCQLHLAVERRRPDAAATTTAASGR